MWFIGATPTWEQCATRCDNSAECLGIYRWTMKSGIIKCKQQVVVISADVGVNFLLLIQNFNEFVINPKAI